jgi:hypothetical protein
LPDVDDFFEEISQFNKQILSVSEALDHSEENLIMYLGLDRIDIFRPQFENPDQKMDIRDCTLAIFYSFSAYFKGDYLSMLDMRFQDSAPYFSINIYYLDEMLQDVWREYSKFITMLENGNQFMKSLIIKYKLYYKEYSERYENNLLAINTEQELEDSKKWGKNFEAMCLVGDNLGILAMQIDRRFKLTKMASERI